MTPDDDRDSWDDPTATLAIKLLVVADVIALLVLAALFGHF